MSCRDARGHTPIDVAAMADRPKVYMDLAWAGAPHWKEAVGESTARDYFVKAALKTRRKAGLSAQLVESRSYRKPEVFARTSLHWD